MLHIYTYRKNFPCTNNFNASTQFIKCKCYQQVNTKNITWLIHVLHYYEFDLISWIVLDKTLNSLYLSEGNARVLYTIRLYNIGTICSLVLFNYTAFSLPPANQSRLFAVLAWIFNRPD